MPTRLRDLKRALEQLAFAVETPRGSSHWRVVRDGRTYPVPAHNGLKTEIGDAYIRGVCRCFGIDERELKKLL